MPSPSSFGRDRGSSVQPTFRKGRSPEGVLRQHPNHSRACAAVPHWSAMASAGMARGFVRSSALLPLLGDPAAAIGYYYAIPVLTRSPDPTLFSHISTFAVVSFALFLRLLDDVRLFFHL
jgi:hypothetical protein